MPGTATVMVVEHPAGFLQACRRCRKVYSKGNFSVGVIVREGQREFKYFAGSKTPVMCCGEEKTPAMVFSDAPSAQEAVDRIQAQINQDRSTKNVKLLSWVDPSAN